MATPDRGFTLIRAPVRQVTAPYSMLGGAEMGRGFQGYGPEIRTFLHYVEGGSPLYTCTPQSAAEGPLAAYLKNSTYVLYESGRRAPR